MAPAADQVSTASAGFLVLVLGGARSGKSRHAQALIERHAPPWTYIATAQALDDEMHARIAEHRAQRGPDWTTIEAPLALPRALHEAATAPALVDCLTLWLTNLMLAEHDIAAAVAALERALDARTAPTVLVANEVGLGIVPENALARRFRDQAGRLNQRLATRAGRVLFTVAGIALQVK
ncbi:MAG: bifunctional adenosylcobinamide kinase/adenosylcobinamide-phosphate guanylyltransferase [Alphaproteobacteria bacterium]|nr:bifunctional adenosylcobinamide kinase/adenosylcobinamide-phosphate guanylyltransferase [Alphaproteobacteria bacterium]